MSHENSNAPGYYDDHIDPALKEPSLNQGLQSTLLPSLPNSGSSSSQAYTTPALSTPDAKALQDYVNGNDSPAPRLRSKGISKRWTGGEHASRKRRAEDAFNEQSTSSYHTSVPASSTHTQPKTSAQAARRSSTHALVTPSAPPFSPIATTQQPIVVGDVVITSSAVGARPFVTSPPPPRRSSSIFSSDLPDLVHDINDEDSPYAQAVKTNPYTTGLVPKAPGEHAPQSATEARDQLKQALLIHRAHSHRSNPRHAPRTGLPKILADLKKRHEAQVKLCEASGLNGDSDTWAELSEITENQRPSASILLCDDLTDDRVKKYEADIARWDKAVGQAAILHKRVYYEEEIAVLEEMIESAGQSKTADAAANGSVARGTTKEAQRQLELRRRVQEMRSGRRFSGLIEKD